MKDHYVHIDSNPMFIYEQNQTHNTLYTLSQSCSLLYKLNQTQSQLY